MKRARTSLTVSILAIDLSHDGWTWGSGCGVWAESPDKVWICQRGEIELPSGAKPWTFAGLLTPPRTNTGRWPYSGNNPGYKLRRHHVIFAVDGNGDTIEEWLQHDKYLAPPPASGPGSVSRGPHKLPMNPYDPQKNIWIVDDDMHEINIFTNNGKLVKTMGFGECRAEARTTSTVRPTSRGYRTGRSSSRTATPERGWPIRQGREVPV